jgi:hypothetical protein
MVTKDKRIEELERRVDEIERQLSTRLPRWVMPSPIYFPQRLIWYGRKPPFRPFMRMV